MNKATIKHQKTPQKEEDEDRERKNNDKRITHVFPTMQERTEAQTTNPPQDELEANTRKEWKELIKHTNNTLNQEENDTDDRRPMNKNEQKNEDQLQ